MLLERQWNLSRRRSSCAHTGRDFAEGDTFYTAIYLNDEDDGFERRDYCEEAWEKLCGSLEPFSFWKSTFEPPSPIEKHAEMMEKEGADALLRRFIEEDDPSTENARFILAVMLERKRILQQTDAAEKKGDRLLFFRQRGTDDVFIIRDPQLRLDDLEAVQVEVMGLLSVDATAEPDEGAEPDAPSVENPGQAEEDRADAPDASSGGTPSS